MLFGVDAWVLAAIAGTLLVGATVQGVVGLGVGLVSAPVVTMLEPSLMPGMMLLMGLFTPLATLAHDRHDIDWRGLAWSLPARVPGTAIGVLLIATVAERSLGILVALMVLAGVLATLVAVDVPITRVNLTFAGVMSGLSATVTSIGGPPIALLYQHQPARRVRSTLAVYFAAGAVFSLVGLGLAGHLSWPDIEVGLLMLPVLVIGVFVAGRLRRRLPGETVRVPVLVVCAASALVLLVRSIVG